MCSPVIVNPTGRRGFLIALEGIDGSGKSTLAAMLYRKLTAKGLYTFLTREPGDTAIGQKLRSILQESTRIPAARTEFLLFAADRAEHFHKVIIPYLEKGAIIISDRLADSSLAYQGYGRGLDLDILKFINKWAMRDIEPDLVVYIDLNENVAKTRIHKSRSVLTTFEQEEIYFWEKARTGFKEILADRKNVIMVNGTRSTESICSEVLEAIAERYIIP